MPVNSSLGIKFKWFNHPGLFAFQPLSETVSHASPGEKRKQLVMSQSLMGEEALAIKAEKLCLHFTFSLH